MRRLIMAATGATVGTVIALVAHVFHASAVRHYLRHVRMLLLETKERLNIIMMKCCRFEHVVAPHLSDEEEK
jgi:hypothetical protein